LAPGVAEAFFAARLSPQCSVQMIRALMMALVYPCGSELAGSDIAPQAIRGSWGTVWTTIYAKYNMPYPVHFGADGKFTWRASYKDGSAIEVGNGMYLSSVHRTDHKDGSWEAHYYGANRFLPDSNNGTNCCCEYVGSRGNGHPTVLADYFIKMVPNSNHLPMEEVCAPYLVECPLHNSTASVVLGQPFIEVYLRPSVIAAKISEEQNQKLLGALALSVAVAAISVLLWVSVRKLFGNLELNKDASRMDSATRLDLEAGARKKANLFLPKLNLPNDDNDIGTPSTLSPSSSAPNSPRTQETDSITRDNSWTSCMSPLASPGSQTPLSPSSSPFWLRGFSEPASSSMAHWDLVGHPDNASLTTPLMEA